MNPKKEIFRASGADRRSVGPDTSASDRVHEEFLLATRPYLKPLLRRPSRSNLIRRNSCWREPFAITFITPAKSHC